MTELKLDRAQVENLIHGGLPATRRGGVIVEHVGTDGAEIRFPYSDRMLRPGNVISGPTLFAAADTAMFAATLALCGPELMAVTTDTQIRFLRGAPPGDVHARAKVMRFGRRLIVFEVTMWTDDAARPAAHATGSYLRPGGSATG